MLKSMFRRVRKTEKGAIRFAVSVSSSFRPYVCPFVGFSACLSAWNNSAPNRRIFVKFDILGFFENSRENSNLIQIRQE